MTFVVESMQLSASVSREILVLENQQAAPLSDALKRMIEPLLLLVEKHRENIGTMHILALCTRLLGISQYSRTKQVIIGFGLSALGRLLGDSPTDSRIQECVYGFTQLFTLLPTCPDTEGSCYYNELIEGLGQCSPLLASSHLSEETRWLVTTIVEKLVLGGCGPGSSALSRDDVHTLIRMYLTLTSSNSLFPTDHTNVLQMLAAIDDINVLVRLLSALQLDLDKDVLDTTIDRIARGLFSTATPIYPQTVISFLEILAKREDPRVAELCGLLLDMLLQTIWGKAELSGALNIETSDRALAHTIETTEVRSEVFEYLMTYLSAEDAELRERLGLYILDLVMALLDTPEHADTTCDLQVMVYLRLLKSAGLIENVLYADTLYFWLEARVCDEAAQKPYWYGFSTLMRSNLSTRSVLERSCLSPHILDVLYIVAKNLPRHMLSSSVKALDKNVVARFFFLGNAFLHNPCLSAYEPLLKDLLKCLDIIIHRCPTSIASDMGARILGHGLEQEDAEDVSVLEALLFMMCAFYTNFSGSHRQEIGTYAVIAAEYISTSLFAAFHLSMDSLDISVRSLLTTLIISLQHLPVSSLPLVTGIRDILISRWNKVTTMEGPVFNRTNYCLYMALLSILEYGKKSAEPSILITNARLQEYPNLSLFQELSSMRYPQDLTEEGFNRYNDGENVAVLTSFGHMLLTGDIDGDNAKIPAKHLPAMCFFGDSIALILPIALRGLNDTTGAQDDIDRALLSLHTSMFSSVREALTLFGQSLLPLPYKLVYRLDPYHNAMMPREYKSNEPRAEDGTYNLLLSMRIKASALFVDDAGKTRLQAADTDWLSLFKDGQSASRIAMHNFFDNFFTRAQQASASHYDRLFILNGLSFAHALFDIDSDYLQSKRELIYNTLHQLLFKSSTLPLPHISYLVSCKTADPGLRVTFGDVVQLMKQDTPQALAVRAHTQTNVMYSRLNLVCVQLLERIAKETTKFSPPSNFLDILSFFLCKHHEEKVRAVSKAILTLLLSEYIDWKPGACPFEETIEGANERLPIYENGVNIQQRNVKVWAHDVLAAKSLFDRYEALDIKSSTSQDALTLKKWLDVSIWPACSDALHNAIDVLGGDHDAQTFAERTNRHPDRQRSCVYVLVCEDAKHALESFLRKYQTTT